MSTTKGLNNLRDTTARERDELAGMVQRIGHGLWQVLAATAIAAAANPGEPTLTSRAQTALSMYELWAGVVDGDSND